MHWFSTYDKEYALRNYYDFVFNTAAFWEDYLVKERGRYVIKKDASFELNITGTNSMQYFQTVVKNDFAVGMGLYSNFKYLEAEDGICSVAIKDETLSACVWCLVYNVNKKITPMDKAFINTLTQHCQQLSK